MDLIWKKIKEESYRAGWRKMLKKTFQLPNGYQSDYDIVDEKKAVHMLPLTPENKVIVLKSFKPGPEKVCFDLPAGFVEDDEDPENAASRELLEELGMKGTIELAGISIDDNYRNTERYTYVFKNCEKIGESNLDKDEIFEVVEMTIDEFKNHLRSGNMTHVESGYIALDFLKLL